MNNLTRLLLTTASVTALVISAQTTARADSASVGGGTITYGTGGTVSDRNSAGGGSFELDTIDNDIVSVTDVTLTKTLSSGEVGGGPLSALQIENDGTGSLTVNFNGTGSSATEESSDASTALVVFNAGTGLTTLDTTGATGGSTFTGTQGIVVIGGGNVSITTAVADQIISNNDGSGFTSGTNTGGYGNGYSAGIYASGGGSADTITIINAATIASGAGTFDAGISVANGDATITNNGNVTGQWAGVLGESTAGNVTVNNNGTISSNGIGIDQLGSGTLTVHNYGTGVIQAVGEGIASSSNTALNITNDAGGIIVGKNDAITGDNAADSITNSGTIAGGTYSGSTLTLSTGNTAVSLYGGGTIVNGMADGSAPAIIEGRYNGIYINGSANITNYANATITSSEGNAIADSATRMTLVNLGTISSGEASTSHPGTNAIYGGSNATINNAGNISAVTASAIWLSGDDNAITNDSAGVISGGTTGYGVEFVGGTGKTIDNYGNITGGTGGIIVDSGANATINLYAGSTTGAINLTADGGGSVVSLYNGLGGLNLGSTDPETGATLQASNTLAGAKFGNITGNTGDVLALRGQGDGYAGDGASGQIDLSSAPAGTNGVISGFEEIDKDDSGVWIFNNNGGDAASNTATDIYLNQGTIDANASGAFGNTTIHVTGTGGLPTIEYSANGTYANPIVLNIASPNASNALTLTPDTGVTANVTGVISDGATPGQSIIIYGGGTVVLGGANAYTGTTTISYGTLSLGTAGNILSSSGVILQTPGTLDVSEQTATPIINNLSGEGGNVLFGAHGITVSNNGTTTEFGGTINQTAAGGLFTKNGNGTLELSGTNTYTVGTVIAGGTLELAKANAIAASGSVNLTRANSVLDVTGVFPGSHATIQNLSGVAGSQVQFGTKGLTVTESGSTTFAGVISGAGGPNGTFTIDGGGTLTLTAQNTYTADTVVSNGTMVLLGANNTLASGNNVTVNDTSTLSIDGNISQTFGNVSLGGGAAGGTLFVGDSAHATITNLTMAGGTVIAQGEGTHLTVEQLSGDAISTIDLGGALMNLGANGAASTYSGTIDIYNDGSSHGILNAGNLTFNGTLTAGEGGTFTATIFNQTGGSVTLASGYYGSPSPGPGTGNVTIYNLSSGSLVLNAGETAGGSLTAGTFNQTGGGVEIDGSNFNFGGILNATTYALSNGCITINGGESTAGTLTATTFNQTGGAVTISDGYYGGNLTATTYNMTAGSLAIVGANNGSAGTLTATTFNQGGGNITLTGGEYGGMLNATTFNQSAGNVTIGSTGEGVATLSATTFNQTGGSVSLGYDGRLATGALTGSNGTIVIGEGELQVGTGDVSSTYGGDISSASTGDGYIDKVGNGTLTLSGNNSNYTGYTEVEAGTLQAGSTTAFGGTYLYLDQPGTLDLAGFNNAFYSLNGEGTVTDSSATADTLELYHGGNFAGVIQDGAGKTSVTLDGGSLYLTGVNTYSGTTTVDSGAALFLGAPGCGTSIGGGSIANSPVTDDGTVDLSYNGITSSIASLSGNGTVDMGNGNLVLANANGTFSGVMQDGGINGGTGASLEIADGRETLTGTNTFTGNTTIDSGAVLQLGNGGTTGSVAGAIIDSGTLAFDLSGSTTLPGSLSGTGGLEVDAGTVTVAAASTFSGASLIAPNATLALSGAGTLDVPLTDNGTFDISAASSGRTIQSLAGNGTVSLGANTLSLSAPNGTFSGAIGGTGGFTLAAVTGGTQTLSGVNTYTGATTIGAQNTLALSGTGSVAASSGIADAGTFDISATTHGATVNALTGAGKVVLGGETLTIADGSGTFSGVASGTGGLTIAGGTETLGGANTYTGATTIGTNGTLALSGSGSVLDSAITDNGTFDISGTTNGTTANALKGAGNVVLGNQTLTLANATGVFSGVASGTGSLTIADGRETLTGTNTFTGNTTIDSGAVLQLGNGGTTGSVAGAIIDSGTLAFDLSGSTTLPGSLSGTGGLEVDAGTVTVAAASTFSGASLIAPNATLALSGAGTLDVPLTDNGTFDISAASSGRTIQSLAGNGTVSLGANTLSLSAPNGTFSGAIGGTGGFTLAAVTGGTQTLSGVNTYTGATTIGAQNTLALSGTGSVAASSGIADAGTFDISATTHGATVNALTGAGKVVLGGETLTIADGSGTFSGVASGTGGLTIAGGTETLSGANTYTGATTIGTNGTLALSGSGSVLDSAITDNGTFDISGTTNGTTANALKGAGNVVLGNQTLTLANATGVFSGVASGTGSLTIADGRETLTGTNTFTGNTTIDSGAVLQLGNGGTTGSVAGAIIDSGTLAFDLSGSTTLPGSLSGTGGLEVDAGTVTLTALSTFSGASLIAPNATLALSGAGTLDVPLTDNGTFDISAASSGRTIQSLAGNGTVSLGANTLSLSASNGTFSGAIGGTGGFTLAAVTGGTQTLSGVNTYTGATTIGAQNTLALSGTGSVAASSGIADAGTFDISATTHGATVNALTGAGKVVLGGETLTIADGSGTFSGVASGTGGLTIAGGTETLGGANTYTGATTIGTNGTLALSGSGSVLDSAITDNGTFDISGTTNGTQITSLNGSGSIYLGSETLTFVDADGAFSGNITDGGHGGSVVVASGTETLTGDNTFSGGTDVEAGSTLIVNSPEALGTGTITFGPNSTIEFTSGNATFTQNAVFEANAPIYDVGSSTITWTGAMSGAGDLAVTGNGGTLVLTNTTNSYTGGTEVYGGAKLEIGADSELGGVAPLQLGDATTAGTLELADSFNLASGRAITLNAGGGTIDTQAFNTTVAQAIGGSGGLTKDGSGKLILTTANTYTGGTTIAKGTVQIGSGGTTGSVTGNITDDGALVFDRSNALTYSGVISGTGTVAQSGAGTTTLTGTDNYTGATSVNAGTLLVNGSIKASAVTVNSGGTLGGTGTVGATNVGSGGTLSPGAGGVGTLSVAGGLTLASGSKTDVDVTSSAVDKIAASGAAKLGGTLDISVAAGTYTAGTDYTLVSSSGLSGTFATVNGGTVTGYDSKIEYSPTAVTFDITASSGGGGVTPPPPVVTYDFSAYGVTSNEIAAGTALEGADPSGTLYKAVGTAVTSDPAAAPGKLNQLSGEIHASARSALIEDGRVIRESVLDHLAQDPDGMTAWGTAFTSDGHIDGNANTGAVHHTNGGFIAGVDAPISGWSPDLRIGVAGAYNSDRASISALDSSVHGSTGHIVAYAGWTGGPWVAKGGIDLGWGNAHTTRNVSFLTESEHSSQSTRTTQVFGDVGYNIALDTLALQPYLDLAHVDVKTGGFTEAGGMAALSGSGAQDNVTYSTLGGRISLNPWAMGTWAVTPRADIGWQHAFSHVSPFDTVAFVNNSQGFAVAGAPLDTDAAALQGGLDIAITPQAVFSLTYDGTFSSKTTDNTFRGGFIWKF